MGSLGGKEVKERGDGYGGWFGDGHGLLGEDDAVVETAGVQRL